MPLIGPDNYGRQLKSRMGKSGQDIALSQLIVFTRGEQNRAN